MLPRRGRKPGAEVLLQGWNRGDCRREDHYPDPDKQNRDADDRQRSRCQETDPQSPTPARAAGVDAARRLGAEARQGRAHDPNLIRGLINACPTSTIKLTITYITAMTTVTLMIAGKSRVDDA